MFIVNGVSGSSLHCINFGAATEQRYGTDGFMMLIPAPQDLVTGEPNQSAIATINIKKYD